MDVLNLLILVPVLIALGLVCLIKSYNNVYTFWKVRGVSYLKPIPIVGNAFSLLAGKLSIGSFFYKIYQASDASYEGFFILHEPWLLIRNPEIIKSILIKDFDYFSDRATGQNTVDDKIGSNMMFFLPTEEWRNIRRKVTRTLSPVNLKHLCSYINVFDDELVANIKIKSKNGPVKIVDALKTVTAKFLLLYIFGEEEKFSETGTNDVIEAMNSIFSPNYWRNIQLISIMIGSRLVEPFGMKFLPSRTANFFRKLFREVAENKSIESDATIKTCVIEYLLQLKKQNLENTILFDEDGIVSHALINLIGGFDTVPITVAYALFELSLNKEIQDRVRKEIVDNVSKETHVSYNDLMKLEYLDMVVKETLRKYPPFPYLDRRCTKDYQIPGSSTIIPKGTKVCMSLHGLHHDPLYFNKPTIFDPERFSKQNVGLIHIGSYMPLGIGPRMCIGEQLSRLMVKIALVKILTKFAVHPAQEKMLKLSQTALVIVPTTTLKLLFKEIDV